jgi:hypothetical protein
MGSCASVVMLATALRIQAGAQTQPWEDSPHRCGGDAGLGWFVGSQMLSAAAGADLEWRGALANNGGAGGAGVRAFGALPGGVRDDGPGVLRHCPTTTGAPRARHSMPLLVLT